MNKRTIKKFVNDNPPPKSDVSSIYEGFKDT